VPAATYPVLIDTFPGYRDHSFFVVEMKSCSLTVTGASSKFYRSGRTARSSVKQHGSDVTKSPSLERRAAKPAFLFAPGRNTSQLSS
jgi:hypothetical protein